MNTYLLPVDDGDAVVIKKVVAKDFRSAQDKFTEILSNEYDLDEVNSFEELTDKLFDEGCFIGKIYDLDEF